MTEPEIFLYLTTTGHKSSNPHEIEIWYVDFEGRYYLISERREQAHWVQNIQQHPTVAFSIGTGTDHGKPSPATARTIDPQAESALTTRICALMDAKYGWSDGLIIEITPTP